MSNIPSDPHPEPIYGLPSQVELANALDRMHGQFNDVGDHASLLLSEWREIETSEVAREFARVAPDVVQAIYWLEIALFRVDTERHL